MAILFVCEPIQPDITPIGKNDFVKKILRILTANQYRLEWPGHTVWVLAPSKLYISAARGLSAKFACSGWAKSNKLSVKNR